MRRARHASLARAALTASTGSPMKRGIADPGTGLTDYHAQSDARFGVLSAARLFPVPTRRCETGLTRSSCRSFNHADPDKFILKVYLSLSRLVEARGKANGGNISGPHHSLVVSDEGFGVCHTIYDAAFISPRPSSRLLA
jgi:hypothetical protein